MFRDLMIVAVVLGAMVAAVVGVVAGSLHRMVKTQNDVAAQAAAPTTAPADTEPAAPATTSASADSADDVAVKPAKSVEVTASDAAIHGGLQLVEGPPQRWKGRGGRGGDVNRPRPHHLSGFRSSQDFAEWTIEVPVAGEYEINVTYGCTQAGHFLLTIADKEVPFVTQGNRYDTLFNVVAIARVTLPAGKTTLTIRSRPESGEYPYLNVLGIELLPTF